MGVSKRVVELDEGSRWEDFVDVSEGVDDWLEFSNGLGNMGVEFEVVLEVKAEDLGGFVVFEWCRADVEVDVGVVSWVEHGVGGFGGVGDEVVGM